jgi:hypothetical protein
VASPPPTPKRRKVIAQNTFEESLATIIEEGWTPIESVDLILEPKPATMIYPRTFLSPLLCFSKYLDDTLFGILTNIVNNNLASLSTTSYHDPRNHPTNISEMKKFYGIFMAMENSWGNETHHLHTHFSELKKNYGFKFGMDRFS